MADRLNRRRASWLGLLVFAASVILFVIDYGVPPEPGMWRWTLFGVGLGLLGAVAGVLVAVSLIVHRNRTDVPRTRA